MVETEMLWRLASDAEDARDFARMRHFAERGAELGEPACWHQLGYMHDIGMGVVVDKRLAMACYRTAWRKHYLASANNIAVLYREAEKPRLMFRWFEKAAQHGDGGGYLEMAKCYRDGIGVRRSPEKMVRCLRLALEQECISEAERADIEAMLAFSRPVMLKDV